MPELKSSGGVIIVELIVMLKVNYSVVFVAVVAMNVSTFFSGWRRGLIALLIVFW